MKARQKQEGPPGSGRPSGPPAELLALVNSALLRKPGTKRSGSELSISCLEPSHKDEHPSATWNTEKGAGFCHSCKTPWSTVQAAERLGIDLPRNGHGSRPKLTTRYEARHPDGSLWGVKIRVDKPDGSKRICWEGGLKGRKLADAPLYGAHELGAMERGELLFLVEGERCRDLGAGIGLQVLGTMTGASSAPSRASLAVVEGWRGPVVLWADNDDVGRAHMRRVATNLPDGLDVRVFCPAGLSAAGDVAEWIELHGAEATARARAAVAELPPILFDALRDALPSERIRDQIHSDADVVLSTSEINFPFRTAREIGEAVPEVVDWLAHGYVARGAVTELDGKPKVSGKTTLMLALVEALVTGGTFLGHAVPRTKCLLLSEENARTLRPALDRAGLLDSDDLSVLFWHDVATVEWPAICAGAVAECERIGAGLLLVDTLSQFARLKDENAAAEVLAAVQPLQAAAATGLAVLLNRHDRKSGGDVGDSGRGSNALTGAVDIVVALSRLEGPNQRPELRVLRALSRFDETLPQQVIELTPTGYIAHAATGAFCLETARGAIRESLPCVEADALDEVSILQRLQGVKRTTLREVLKDPEVKRIGSGKKGQPFRYYLDPDCILTVGEKHRQKALQAGEESGGP